jgi:hypothetical protein
MGDIVQSTSYRQSPPEIESVRQRPLAKMRVGALDDAAAISRELALTTMALLARCDSVGTLLTRFMVLHNLHTIASPPATTPPPWTTRAKRARVC